MQQIDRVLVTDGTVECRMRRTTVDLDECFHCAHIREVNEHASPPFVICDISGRLDADDGGQVLLQWWLQRTRRARTT